MDNALERACSEKEASRPPLARCMRACRQQQGLLMAEITPTDERRFGVVYKTAPVCIIPSVFDYHSTLHFALVQSLLV